MMRPWVLALLLLGDLVMLTPLAQASPPDPSWISGIYDGGDFDDVVTLVTSAASTVELSAPTCLDPGHVVLGLIPFGEAGSSSRPAGPAFLGRAPPLS
jgi:hypothetical protein